MAPRNPACDEEILGRAEELVPQPFTLGTAGDPAWSVVAAAS